MLNFIIFSSDKNLKSDLSVAIFLERDFEEMLLDINITYSWRSNLFKSIILLSSPRYSIS